jgi:flagellar biosynthesis/type III secretory pathway protein FliH
VEALAEFRARLETLERVWGEALKAFLDQRDELLSMAERDVVRLACAIAERVTKRSIALDAGVVRDQLRAVLATVVRPTELVISIHPSDRAMVEASLPMLLVQFPSTRHAEVVDDPVLEPGSIVARTRAGEGIDSGGTPGASTGLSSGLGGEIDASIQTQLDRIVEALLPGVSKGQRIASDARATSACTDEPTTPGARERADESPDAGDGPVKEDAGGRFSH